VRVAPVEIDHAIRTIDHTISAADAFFGIMHGNAVVEFVHSTRWTAPYTGSIFTVIAKRWGIMESNIRKSSGRFGYFAGPVNTFRYIIFISTGNAARATAGTALQINNHRIS
jgi:hypothetical protein